MNFAVNRKSFDNNYIYIMEPVNNNVLDNGTFHRLIYSNSHMTLNSLIFKVTFYNTTVTKNFNKYKLSFDVHNSRNIESCNYIKYVEDTIIDKFRLGELPKRSLIESIYTDNIKLYSDKKIDNRLTSIDVYLKISGIWVNKSEYGLTYKFSG